MNSIQGLSEKLLTEFLDYCTKKKIKPIEQEDFVCCIG